MSRGKKNEHIFSDTEFSDTETETDNLTYDDLIKLTIGLKKSMQQDKLRIVEFEEREKTRNALNIKAKEMMANQQKKIYMLENNSGKISDATRKELRSISTEVSDKLRKQIKDREEALYAQELGEYRGLCSGSICDVELVKRRHKK